VKVPTFIPAHETVTNGRKKHSTPPEKINKDAIDFGFFILSPFE
jgi:hypothetical protein